MSGTYDPTLVVLSCFLSILASFTALNISDRLNLIGNRSIWPWIAFGGCIMGRHLVDAFRRHAGISPAGGCRIRYSHHRRFLADCDCGFGRRLRPLARFALHWPQLIVSAIVMGLGVAGMHYLGMQAMSICSGIRYQPWLVVLSVIIAILARRRLVAGLRPAPAEHIRQNTPDRFGHRHGRGRVRDALLRHGSGQFRTRQRRDGNPLQPTRTVAGRYRRDGQPGDFPGRRRDHGAGRQDQHPGARTRSGDIEHPSRSTESDSLTAHARLHPGTSKRAFPALPARHTECTGGRPLRRAGLSRRGKTAREAAHPDNTLALAQPARVRPVALVERRLHAIEQHTDHAAHRRRGLPAAGRREHDRAGRPATRAAPRSGCPARPPASRRRPAGSSSRGLARPVPSARSTHWFRRTPATSRPPRPPRARSPRAGLRRGRQDERLARDPIQRHRPLARQPGRRRRDGPHLSSINALTCSAGVSLLPVQQRRIDVPASSQSCRWPA